ncbi:MAG TPA: hypothetical protein VK852_08945, partial [Desulfobacterales bacterium]|nr:hypothetical protein [Desulfobacterales bacterium]
IARYGAGFWFVTQAHSPAHIGICAGECNAGDGPKDKQDVQLFLAETLRPPGGLYRPPRHAEPAKDGGS